MRPPAARPLVRTTAALAAAVCAACSPDAPAARTVEEDPVRPDTAAAFEERTFERNVVFLATGEDSVLAVPWLVSARTRPDGVERHARGLLARGPTVEPFFEATWESPPTRVPWRILPRGSMRLIVGDEERLLRIVFEEGTRRLHVVLEEERVEWSGQRGESFRLVEGALLLGSRRVPGLVLDMNRTRRGSDPRAGDWAVLTSGDSLQVVLHRPVAGEPGALGAWRGWARGGDVEGEPWPLLTVEWEAVRPFEKARREVPMGWRFASAGGELEGSLEALGAHLREGTGEGPQLPVDAVFTVAGTLRLGDVEYPVRGLLRHEQR